MKLDSHSRRTVQIISVVFGASCEMAEKTHALRWSAMHELLSRCWVPIIHLESRFMFAYGNTLMEDFLEDLQVGDTVDILMLGVGDIRYMLKTVAGLDSRPHAAGCPLSMGYTYSYLSRSVCLSVCHS